MRSISNLLLSQLRLILKFCSFKQQNSIIICFFTVLDLSIQSLSLRRYSITILLSKLFQVVRWAMLYRLDCFIIVLTNLAFINFIPYVLLKQSMISLTLSFWIGLTFRLRISRTWSDCWISLTISYPIWC